MNRTQRCSALAALFCVAAQAQNYRSVHPEIASLVAQVSTERIAQTLKRLESFGTRDTHSKTDDPEIGIGAARRWILNELKSYSPRLEVRFDSWKVKKQGRIQRELELVNVVAVLPGTADPERQVLLSAHYDSMVMVRKPGAARDDPKGYEWAATAAQPKAPGVSDDASGTAAVMEISRILSQHEWNKTLV